MSNVYQKTYFPEVITLRDSKTYTIFKTITAIKCDGVSLAIKTNTTDVENTAGSFYQNTSNSLLYIHFPDSGSGANYTTITYFKLYFASENIIFNNNFYEGRLNNIGSISNQTSYLLHQGTEIEGGNLTLNNCDGFFDQIYEKFIWERATLDIKLGSDFMNYNNFLTCGKWYIENKNYNENNFLLDYFSVKKELDKMIPSDMYDTTTYPNLENNAVGRFIPIAYGTFNVLEEAPILTCINKKYGETVYNITTTAGTNTTTVNITANIPNQEVNYLKGYSVEWGSLSSKVTASSYISANDYTLTIETMAGMTSGVAIRLVAYTQQQYKIAGHAITSISSVHIDYGDGLGWRSIASSNTLGDGTFIITTPSDGRYAMWQENETKVKALFVGKNSDGNPSDIVKDLCTTYAELIDGTDLDSVSFTASKADGEMVIHDYIDSQISIRDEIDKIVLSCGICYFYTALSGKLKFVIWTPERTTGYDEYQDYEYFAFNVKDIGSDIRNKISVGYAKNYEKDEYHYTTVTNNPSIYKYEERETEYVDTLLLNKSDADTLAQRLMWLVNQPGRYVNFETHLRALAKTDTGVETNIGSKLYVTKTKSPNSTAGGMNTVLMEVTGISRNLESGTVGIDCVDTRGMGLNVGLIMDTTDPNWSSATDEQKQISGFISDSNGYVSYPDGDMWSIIW